MDLPKSVFLKMPSFPKDIAGGIYGIHCDLKGWGRKERCCQIRSSVTCHLCSGS